MQARITHRKNVGELTEYVLEYEQGGKTHNTPVTTDNAEYQVGDEVECAYLDDRLYIIKSGEKNSMNTFPATFNTSSLKYYDTYGASYKITFDTPIQVGAEQKPSLTVKHKPNYPHDYNLMSQIANEVPAGQTVEITMTIRQSGGKSYLNVVPNNGYRVVAGNPAPQPMVPTQDNGGYQHQQTQQRAPLQQATPVQQTYQQPQSTESYQTPAATQAAPSQPVATPQHQANNLAADIEQRAEMTALYVSTYVRHLQGTGNVTVDGTVVAAILNSAQYYIKDHQAR